MSRVPAITLFALAACGLAPAAGYYNMPTSLQQCLGVGFGPGHHAPLLLGPCWKSGVTAQGVQRLPSALAPPPPACDFGGPSYWGAADGYHAFGAAPMAGPASPGYAAAYPEPTPAYGEAFAPAPVAAPKLNPPRGAEVLPTPRPTDD